MRLFINSLAASAGGGLTYIRNVVPHLASVPGVQIAVLAPPGLGKEFARLANVEFMGLGISPVRRFLYEQVKLPALLRSWHAEVLLSTGNFGLRNSPVPQLLLSRNSIYISADFYRDLLSRHEYGMWIDTRIHGALARRSIDWADVTVAPSEAFAAELRRWSSATSIVAVHHGFDYETFAGGTDRLPVEVEQKLSVVESSLKLLFVSHYNYYRNFETLIRALPAIREGLADRQVKLLLTCKFAPGENPGAYRPASAGQLVSDLDLGDTVIELGPIPYHQLHHLYRRADIYLTAAYTETFAHPLVEAMACGLPIVASDLPVHREICGDSAIYFSTFSPEELARRVLRLCRTPEMTARLATAGRKRWPKFSWAEHVQTILEISERLRATSSLMTRHR